MTYEKLLKEALQHDIDIYERPLSPRIKGLYSDNVIWINKRIESNVKKACILAEELGHYHTSAGDILDQSQIINRKQERLARTWAYKKLVPLSKVIDAYKKGINSRHEFAEFLGITEQFLLEAIHAYQNEYGIHVNIDRYIIQFNPLSVTEIFEDSKGVKRYG